MTTLRQKVLVLVSAIVVTLALVVLPGCAKKQSPTTKKPATTKTDKAIKGME
jgi:type IV pilus biogenesis protein CpaD/CtpE